MGALNDILKAKLETLLGERGTGKDAAVRRGELDALLTKAVNLSTSKTGGATAAQVAEALKVAKRAEAAVEAVRAAQADIAAETADDTAQNTRLSEAISLLFQWNGGTYTLRVPATGITGKMLEDQIADEAISIAKFATGLRPVELLTSLPTSGNFNGRHVYRTTDQSLWRHNGSAWVNTNSTSLLVGKIVAGQIEVGAVGAQELAALAVSAKHMAIANWVNLFDGADDPATSPFAPAPAANGGAGFWDTVTTYQGQPSIGITSDWGTGTMYQVRDIPVTPGTEYYIEFWANRNAAWNGSPSNSKLRVGNQTGAFVADIGYGASQVPAGAWTKRSAVITVPAGVTKLRITLASDATAGWVRLAGLLMRQRGGGELIVDGAVKAIHTDTASFAASGLAIFGGELKSSNFIQGSTGWRIKNTGEAELESLVVRTRHIEAGAVSADWNSYTAGWITYSGNSGGSVQSVTINDSTVNGCIAWITFSAQIGLYSNLGGLASGAISLRLGSDVIGQWDVMQNVAPSVEIQLPISITRRIALPATGPHFIAADASAYGSAELGSLSHFRLRYRRLEINVMKR